ncbi:MAG: hypothetical protein AB1696_06535 [Planctomycetota bacterium]
MSTCRFSAAVCIVALATFAGCTAGRQGAGRDGELVPAVAQEFADVPAPVGFALEDAYSFNVPPNRMFLLKYVGKSDREKVRDFYKNNMKQLGWMETSESTFGDTLFLDFAKQPEHCAVEIIGKKGKIRVRVRSHR